MSVVYFDVATESQAKMAVLDADHTERRRILNFAFTSFSFHDKSKDYTWMGKHGYDDCVVEFYNRETDMLPMGLVPRLSRYIKIQYPDVHIRVSNAIRALYTPPHGEVSLDDIKEYAGTLNLHSRETGIGYMPFDHQYRLAYLALNKRRCSLLACTSSGKSLAMMIIARYLVAKENRKVLIIVPSMALVVQLFDNFYTDYGWDDAAKHCTLIYSGSKDKLDKSELERLKSLGLGEESKLRDITISTWQSLQKKESDFFKVFDAVMVDEAHSDRGEKLRGIVEQCVNANNFKVGFSGTLPDVDMDSDPEDCIDAGYIEGNLGQKIDVVHLRELVANGTLTPVEVTAIFIPYPNSVRPTICSSKCRYQDEADIMVNNGSRKDIMDRLIDTGQITVAQNTVMLYKGKENLHIMHDYLKERHPEFNYHVIEGSVKAADREWIRKELDRGPGNILIATYGCMKQGVNIKLLHNLVFAEPGKSEYMIMQSVGRVVRKHPDKTLARVFDLVDDASYYTAPRHGGSPRLKMNYMMQHYYKRVGYYAKENIPVTEYHLDGLFEAKITPDDVRKKRAESIDRAKKKADNKKATQAVTHRPTFFR